MSTQLTVSSIAGMWTTLGHFTSLLLATSVGVELRTSSFAGKTSSHLAISIALFIIIFQMLPNPTVPRLSLWKLGSVELVASGTCDLYTIRTTTDCTVYGEACKAYGTYGVGIFLHWSGIPSSTGIDHR